MKVTANTAMKYSEYMSVSRFRRGSMHELHMNLHIYTEAKTPAI